MTPCRALRASSPSAATQTTSSIWTWILFGDAFCTNTYLQPDDVTHRSLYTEQFLPAGIPTQRGLCTEKLLYTDTFTHRGFTQRRKFLHTDALYKDIFAHIKKRRVGTFTHRTFCHREAFAQNDFYTDFLAPKKIDTEEIVHTDCAKKKYTPIFLHAETLPKTVFLHSRNSSAQNPLRTIFLKCTTIIADTWFLPVFTKRGFVSSSWSPTFRVPPLKFWIPSECFRHQFVSTDAYWSWLHIMYMNIQAYISASICVSAHLW